MTLSNVALTNTFDDWRTRTNQLVVLANQITENVYTTTGNVIINNIYWNQSGGSNVSLNIANGYIVGNGFGITAIQNTNISGTLTNSQLQNNRITITSNNASLVVEGLSAGSIALGNTVYMNVQASGNTANASNNILATTWGVNAVLNRVETANSTLDTRINTTNATAYSIATSVGASGNVYATSVGTSGNNFAGLMANSANALTDVGLASANAWSNTKLSNTAGVVLNGSLVTLGNVSVLGNATIRSATLTASPVAGMIEYDGTTLYGTPSTSYGRAAIPLTLYTSGSGTTGINGTTDYALFPAAGDTITLPIGTYLVKIRSNVSVTGSTVASPLNLNLRGGGTAVGTFTWGGVGSPITAGSANNISASATALGTVITIAPTTILNPRQYASVGEGILKITTAGTIVPSYQWSGTLTSGTTTLFPENYMIIQTLDTQSAAAFGPAGAGWG